MKETTNHLVPVVVEQTSRGERSFIALEVQELGHDQVDPEKDINLYINSPGGA
jgi:hypothetical protein